MLTMDPDIALAEALAISITILEGEAEDGDDVHLAELVTSLNGWLGRGGFMPSAWEHQRV